MSHESFLEGAIRDFLMLFVTIDPIGTLSLFVPLTRATPPSERPRVAFRAVLYAGIVLLGFLVLGQVVLNGLGVRLTSFAIAGSIILFLIGLQMVFGTGVAETSSPEPGHDVAVFPLAIPSIASPGAMMAVVILTDNDRFTVADQAETAAVLLFVLALTLVILLAANRIHRVIGDTGASVMVRVMGMILAALAAEEILTNLVQVVSALKTA